MEASQQVQPLLLAGADLDRRVGVRDGADRVEGDFVLDRQAEALKKAADPQHRPVFPDDGDGGAVFPQHHQGHLVLGSVREFFGDFRLEGGVDRPAEGVRDLLEPVQCPFPAVGRARDDWGPEAGFQHLGRREPLFPQDEV